MKRISSKIEKEIKHIQKTSKNKDLTVNMSQLSYKLVHDEMLQQLKQKLTKITEEKPTNFVLRMEHKYVDTPNQPKPFALFGRWKGDFKGWATRKICKEKDAIVGEAFYGGMSETGKKILKLKIFKGKAKTKTDKLIRTFRAFIPKAKYVLEFVVMDDDAVMLDGESLDETDEDVDNDDTPVTQSPKQTLKVLTQKIINTHALLNPVRIQKRIHTDEDIKNLGAINAYLEEWFDNYTKLTVAEQAPLKKRKVTFSNLQKQTTALLNMAQNNTATREQGNNNSNYNAAEEAAKIGATMIDKIEYQKGYAYIPFTGKKTGNVYKKGDKIDPADATPTWCNQFAMDLAKDVLGENTPFDFLPEGKGFTNANELYDFMHEANGVLFQKIGKFETAWEEVNKGKLVYFVSKAKIGHIATGYPTKPEQMKTIRVGDGQDKVGLLVQAGSKTDILMLNKVWSNPQNVSIFVNLNNEKSDQEPDPNLFIKIYNKIKDPVGVGAKNYKGDIKVIQQLLVNAGKDIGKGGPFDNGVDGSLGKNPASSKTVAAIKEIQTGLGLPASGQVAMGDPTWMYLYNKSKPIIDSANTNDDSPNDDNNTGGNTPTTPPQPTAKTIKASVGEGANNNEDDVRVIQQLLVDKNFDLGAWGPKKDGVDGDYGNATKKAIQQFQQDNGLAVTALIEPNSETWAKLTGQSTPNDNPSDQELKPEQIQFQFKGTAKPLNAKADKVLREILAKANEPNVVITSTLRTAKEQASIMYNNIVQFGAATNKKFYGSNGKHVVQVYSDLKATGKTPEQIKVAMETKINELGPATISKHCDAGNPAIDIHPKSLKNRGTFESALAADGRVNFIAPPKDPFYHLEII